MKRYFSLLVPLLLFFGAPLKASTYTNAERHFAFDYDGTKWEVVPEKPGTQNRGQEVDREMAQKTLVTIQHKVADDKYHARFSVVTDSLKKFKGTPPEQLVQYRNYALQFLKSQRFHILSTDEAKLPGVPGPAAEITANQRDFGLTFRQVIFIHDGEAYMLTAATRTNKFEEYQPELQKIFNSFHFITK